MSRRRRIRGSKRRKTLQIRVILRLLPGLSSAGGAQPCSPRPSLRPEDHRAHCRCCQCWQRPVIEHRSAAEVSPAGRRAVSRTAETGAARLGRGSTEDRCSPARISADAKDNRTGAGNRTGVENNECGCRRARARRPDTGGSSPAYPPTAFPRRGRRRPPRASRLAAVDPQAAQRSAAQRAQTRSPSGFRCDRDAACRQRGGFRAARVSMDRLIEPRPSMRPRGPSDSAHSVHSAQGIKSACRATGQAGNLAERFGAGARTATGARRLVSRRRTGMRRAPPGSMGGDGDTHGRPDRGGGIGWETPRWRGLGRARRPCRPRPGLIHGPIGGRGCRGRFPAGLWEAGRHKPYHPNGPIPAKNRNYRCR